MFAQAWGVGSKSGLLTPQTHATLNVGPGMTPTHRAAVVSPPGSKAREEPRSALTADGAWTPTTQFSETSNYPLQERG